MQNLKKRAAKSLSIANNMGSYISLKISYAPLFIFMNGAGVEKMHEVSILPLYAVRKPIGKHWNFEVGGGIGYKFLPLNSDKKHQLAMEVRFRIGYIFFKKIYLR
jgi:hypothetical protein